MTPERIAELVSLYEKLEEAESELEIFCFKVVQGMKEDWKSVESVKISGGYVCFTAHWYGSYQAHDLQHLKFPVELLSEDESVATAYCMSHRGK